MKKHDKKFLHDTDEDVETAVWKVETLSDDAIDVVFELSNGRNNFELWEFITTHGQYDDAMQKIIAIEVALEELKHNLRKAVREVTLEGPVPGQ